MLIPRNAKKKWSLFALYRRHGFNVSRRESLMFMLGAVGVVLALSSIFVFFSLQNEWSSASFVARGAVQPSSLFTIAVVSPSNGFSFSSGQFSIEAIANPQNPVSRMQISINGVAWLTCAKTATCGKVIRADNSLWQKGANRISVTAIDQANRSVSTQVMVYKK